MKEAAPIVVAWYTEVTAYKDAAPADVLREVQVIPSVDEAPWPPAVATQKKTPVV